MLKCWPSIRSTGLLKKRARVVVSSISSSVAVCGSTHNSSCITTLVFVGLVIIVVVGVGFPANAVLCFVHTQ